jgi:ATP-dependent DNA helicase DinG
MTRHTTRAALAPPIAAPAVAVGAATAVIVEADGIAHEMPRAEAGLRIAAMAPPILCHAPAVARRLGVRPFPALDLLELFAFVRPAAFVVPTSSGLAKAVGLPAPAGLAAEARALVSAAGALLADLTALDERDRAGALAIARAMAAGGWRWGSQVIQALGGTAPSGPPDPRALAIWRTVPEWQDMAPEAPPGNQPVAVDAALARLARLTGPAAEARPQQRDYAAAVTAAFQPGVAEGEPHAIVAEAGTGVGKTLGYIAPASLWAEANHGAVWISTYTRNLQRQIDGELDRLFPDPREKARRVVVRKGRENYLCLLNFEEAASRVALDPGEAVVLGLVARWAEASRDGDLAGGDFPAWLADLFGPARTLALADRRGECIYSACDHFKRCFIERTVRRARRADIVVANHALVMAQAAMGGLDDRIVPTRLVFDEGHHLFDAADGAFSAQLSGREAAELRRWLIGSEESRRRRARGLRSRIADIAAEDEAVGRALAATLEAARALPGPGWNQRIAQGAPRGATERFLALVRVQVHARASAKESAYDLETETQPALPGLIEAGDALAAALDRLAAPMRALAARLAALLDERAADLDSATRQRIEAVCRGIARRAEGEVAAWRAMLDALARGTPSSYVDWFSVARAEAGETDIGMHRHWVDPMAPFAEFVARPAHGVVVTSATLRDATGNDGADWQAAEVRSGSRHLPGGAARVGIASPFDYAAQTRIFVVRDLAREDAAQIAAAFRELFVAAGGGALGLFTAIARLRDVHKRIAQPLEEAGIPLYAQHVDRMNTATLVDIFREDERACLLGTDAVRDGIDVPGRSLRLIAFDRVPWPRPTILHRARREAFRETRYDDMIARLRLKQAYGRLVRRADDIGVFVMLDARLPTRLLGAFPAGVRVARVGLAEAIADARKFLAARGG